MLIKTILILLFYVSGHFLAVLLFFYFTKLFMFNGKVLIGVGGLYIKIYDNDC